MELKSKGVRKTKVFISYSRQDRQFATKLFDALEATDGLEVFRDTEDILPTEEWRHRLQQLIGEADTIVFALSPDSASSKVCAWEIEQAENLNKRIAPIVIKDVDSNQIPQGLTKYNYIFFTENDDFENALCHLIQALNTDIDWIREHTRLGEFARRWDAQRKSGVQPLRGKELTEAEDWLARQPDNAPSPTLLHREYIAFSRRSATQRQRFWMGGAFAVAVVTTGLAGFAYLQRDTAITAQLQEARQRELAQKNEKRANMQEQIAKRERDAALLSQSKFLSNLATNETLAGDAATGLLLALEATPDSKSADQTQQNRPFWGPSELALDSSARANKELFVLSGHRKGLNSIAFSPDGSFVVTGSPDHTARIWDTTTGLEKFILAGHTNTVSSVAVTPDSSKVVTGSDDHTARIWNAKTGALIATLEGHELWVHDVAVSPNGRFIVTASEDETVRIWDTMTGKELAVARGHQGGVTRVIVSSDSSFFVTAAGHLTGQSDTTARIWDARTGVQLAVLDGHNNGILSLALSPDNSFVVTGSGDMEGSTDNSARVWDTKTGKLTHLLGGHESAVQTVAVSPNGKLIVTATGGQPSASQTVRIWDAENGQLRAILKGHESPIQSIVISPDSKLLFTASGENIDDVIEDSTLRTWDIETATQRSVFRGHKSTIMKMSLSSDGRSIATASWDGTARILSTGSGREHSVIRGYSSSIRNHDEWVGSVAVAPDSSFVVTGAGNINSVDGTARIWDVARRTIRAVLEGHSGAVESVAVSPDSSFVVTASRDGTARLWSSITGAERFVFNGHSGVIEDMAIAPDGTYVLTGSYDNSARIWDTASGKIRHVLNGHSGHVTAVAIAPDSSFVVTGSGDNTVRIWDALTGRERSNIAAHDSTVMSVAVSPDSTFVVTAGWDKKVKVWDAESGAHRVTLLGHEDSVWKAVVSPDGAKIVTVSTDTTARVWDRKSGQTELILSGHGQGLLNVALSSDGSFLVTTSSDRSPRVWNMSTGEQVALLAGHDDGVAAVAIAPDDSFVVTGSYDKTARVWRTFKSRQALVDHAKNVVPRCLTASQRRKYFLSPDPPDWCRSMQKWPYDPLGLIVQGANLLRNGWIDRAEVIFKEALNLKPDLFGYVNELRHTEYEKLITNSLDLNLIEDAEYALNLISGIDPHPKNVPELKRRVAEAFNKEAWNLFLQKQYSSGLVAAKSAVSHFPDSANFLDTRGQIFLALDRHQDAISDLSKAVDSGISSSATHFSLGRAYESSDQDDLALQHYKKALELTAGNSAFEKSARAGALERLSELESQRYRK